MRANKASMCSYLLTLSFFFLFSPVLGYGATWQLTKLHGNLSGQPRELTNVNGTVFFVDGFGGTPVSRSRLWKTNGTPSGTVLVKDVYPSGDSNIAELTDVNGILFFVATDEVHGRELWKSDGTEAGTVLVKNLSSFGDSSPQFLTSMNGFLFFAATTTEHGRELWKSDGTEAGTVMVKDVQQPYISSALSPQYLTNVNGVLFFRGDDPEGGRGIELWRSDGTAAGTWLVKDIYPGGSSYPENLTAIGNMLFFSADDGSHGNELWKSNGTESGTTLVRDIWFSTSSSAPRNLTPYGFSVMFSAAREDLGRELWISVAGLATDMVKDIADSVLHPNSNPEYLTENKAILYFAATSYYGGGRELWVSNGTESGTVMVKDIHPSGDSNPQYLTSSSGHVFFNADDGVHGQELWVSDGTETGTVMVKDIFPSGDSNPRGLLNVNTTLYFFSSTAEGGVTLWKCEEEFPWPLFLPAIIRRD